MLQKLLTIVSPIRSNSSAPVYKIHWHVQGVLHISIKAEVIIEHERQGPASVVVHVCPYVTPPAKIACMPIASTHVPQHSACICTKTLSVAVCDHCCSTASACVSGLECVPLHKDTLRYSMLQSGINDATAWPQHVLCNGVHASANAHLVLLRVAVWNRCCSAWPQHVFLRAEHAFAQQHSVLFHVAVWNQCHSAWPQHVYMNGVHP